MEKRFRIGIVLLLVGLLGLLLRKVAGFPLWIGDSLWAAVLYLALRFCWPKTALKKIALLALVISLLDEFSQLIRWHWLVSFRLTTLGYLLLGQGFQWADLLAYAFGIACLFLIDSYLSKKG